MKRPKLNLKQKSGRKKIDVDDFLRKIQQAKSAGDEFTLNIYRTVYPKYPRHLKEVLKRKGITL